MGGLAGAGRWVGGWMGVCVCLGVGGLVCVVWAEFELGCCLLLVIKKR